MANTVTVKELVDSSGYVVLSGEEFLGNKITTSEISRPGVELTGFFNFYPSARIQLLGKTELTFIERMTAEERLIVMRRLCSKETPCFVIGRRLPHGQYQQYGLLSENPEGFSLLL